MYDNEAPSGFMESAEISPEPDCGNGVVE